VNVEEDQRDPLLRACVRHLADDGVVVIERYAPDWVPEDAGTAQIGDVAVTMRDVRRAGRRPRRRGARRRAPAGRAHAVADARRARSLGRGAAILGRIVAA
jgi:hypothetical protein